MKQTFELNAELREDVGKGASRRLRRLEGRIPAIIYGADEKPESITLRHDDLMHALENEAFYSHILTLHVGKQDQQVVLKDLQRHPYKKKLLHADFLRVKADAELHMHVPLHFVGEEVAPGVKIGGGVVSHHMSEVEIRCLPADLPEYIEVDLSGLELNDSISLSELKLPKGVSLTVNIEDSDNDQQVVAVHAPRKVEELADTAAPEAPETEITSEKKEESSEETK